MALQPTRVWLVNHTYTGLPTFVRNPMRQQRAHMTVRAAAAVNAAAVEVATPGANTQGTLLICFFPPLYICPYAYHPPPTPTHPQLHPLCVS